MAAGHAAEAAVVRPHVGQVVRGDEQPAVHAAVAEVVGHDRTVGRAAAVQPGADRAEAAADDVQVDVVQAEAVPQHLAQAGLDPGVVDDVQERLAPAQHVAEAMGRVVRGHLGRDALVQECVHRPDLVGIERVRDPQVALQIEQVSVVVGHVRFPLVPCAVSLPALAGLQPPRVRIVVVGTDDGGGVLDQP